MEPISGKYFHLAKAFIVIALSAVVAACGGGGGGDSPTSGTVSTVSSGTGNVLAITVDKGPAGNSVNQPFVSVTICTPGTSNCQTIDHVLLDTGSYGLRLIKSAVSATLPAVSASNGNPLAECAQFVTGYAWGSVRKADIKLGEKVASSIPVQIVGDTTSPYNNVPSACSNLGSNYGTVSALGANGILGLGLWANDCPACTSSAAPMIYYSCTTSSCTSVAVAAASQVTNPATKFASDNNGISITLPAVSASGATSLTGTLTFGIGTQTNNGLGSAQIYPANAYGDFTVTYKGKSYANSFIDSGSNGLFFDDSSIPQCSYNTDFYCPATSTPLTFTTSGRNINLTLENADTSITSSTVAINIGAPLGMSTSIDLGLPFFFGRTVFVGFNGATMPNNVTGPLWAY